MTPDTQAPASGGLNHPRAFEPLTFVVTLLLSIVGAFIGIRLITTLGISANTSVIGALVAMALGRVAIFGLGRFRDKNRQNLAQTAISSATFGAANALLAPIAVAWAFNRVDLIWPIFFGAVFGLLVDAWVLYRCFGSQFLPATNPWPPGVAAAETIKAGDEGGRNAVILFGSTIVAGLGTFFFALPFSAAGVALIGNIWALLMWGLGLMTRQYVNLVPGLESLNINAEFIPHGVMVGAGVVSLIQAFFLFTDRAAKKKVEAEAKVAEARLASVGAASGGRASADHSADPAYATSVDASTLRRTLLIGYSLFLGCAVALALVTGLLSEMSLGMLILWVLFAAVAAFVHEIIVGLAAMHSGWFPAFAVTLIFLVLGLLMGFPDIPMIVLVAYCSATGPAFADMGYDLKAGWLLRKDASFEPDYARYDLQGKREQFKSSVLGLVVAAVCVLLLWRTYFENGQIPPVSKVYADTVAAGLTNPHTLQNMLTWAIPGAIIQALGGPKRQMGVMLATGLLISAPNACWAIFAALLVRVAVRRWKGEQAEENLSLVGAGFIAGDALASAANLFKVK
ncbi:MAG: OPT/YSL family transporter [Propioniciclava sp.]|uniref:OPT/YSL family transporter n=1 Tax=Propioniciclava sp. TaxID=2038686 RepID=UPI0039E5698E